MPNLGSQFDNTYWQNPRSGMTHYYENRYSERKHDQGLLFHPGTGTQSYSDPDYSDEQRYKDIKSAINPTLKGGIDERDALGVMMDTKFSKSDFENNPPKVVVGNTQGIRSAAHYTPELNKLHVSESSALDFSGDRTTFAHEWGHKVDSDIANQRIGRRDYPIETQASILKKNKRSRIIVSPISEGIADAFGERYGMRESDFSLENAGHEDQFNPLKNRARGYDLQQSGYTVKSSHWKTKQHQALYAATRLHVAMNGHAGIESLPNIEELANTHLTNLRVSIKKEEGKKWGEAYEQGKHYKEKSPEEHKDYSFAARHLYLGKLASEQPAVREGLSQLGLSDISDHAQEFYQKTQERTKSINNTQLSFQFDGTSGNTDAEIKKIQAYPDKPNIKNKDIERPDLKAKRAAANAEKKRNKPGLVGWNNLF